MTELERKKIMNLADTIQGEINRMCVTKELAELDTMYGHANYRPRRHLIACCIGLISIVIWEDLLK